MKDSHQHKACLKNWYQGEYCLKVSIKLYFWCKLILLIDIVSLFVEKSHRSPSDLETRIAHCHVLTQNQSAHKCNIADNNKNVFIPNMRAHVITI